MKALLLNEWYLLKSAFNIVIISICILAVCLAVVIYDLYAVDGILSDENAEYISFFAYTIPSVIFWINVIAVNGKSFIMSAVMPLKRASVVNVKYLWMCGDAMCCALFTVIVSAIIRLISNNEAFALEFLKFGLFDMIFSMFVLCLVFPLILKFGTAASYLIPAIFGGIIGTEMNFPRENNDFSSVAFMAIVCGIVLCISYIISLAVYKRKDIK